jgi:hypothetical protein
MIRYNIKKKQLYKFDHIHFLAFQQTAIIDVFAETYSGSRRNVSKIGKTA